MLAQLGGHDLAVAFEDQEDFLSAQMREFGWRVIVHGPACLCMRLRVCARLAKPQDKHKPANPEKAPDINSFDLSNHEGKFHIFSLPVQNGAVTHVLDGNFMNLNFAFACMIVVSFTIALVHT
ncbi:hypothetical protein [Pseudomonas sp. C2B4]|uniref:hypothetical protein n=1 Tax=Pseudomonas sp. C2B4 TaxID=2735270 RepID=UPI001586034C|nr:hypothetical protein [Pseudomonas sp. C2B4]NUU38186.1 hypothetical protein [Pseudomonas sp. C2B4]